MRASLLLHRTSRILLPIALLFALDPVSGSAQESSNSQALYMVAAINMEFRKSAAVSAWGEDGGDADESGWPQQRMKANFLRTL